MLKPLRTLTMAVALVAVTLTSPAAFAEQGRGRGDRGERGAAAAQKLGLTDQQKDQIKAIREQNRPALREAHEALRARRQALQDAMTATTVDPNLVETRRRELSAAHD